MFKTKTAGIDPKALRYTKANKQTNRIDAIDFQAHQRTAKTYNSRVKADNA